MSHESIKSSCILCIQKAALRALTALKSNKIVTSSVTGFPTAWEIENGQDLKIQK